MGRYLERTEHFARYIFVKYDSILDAPLIRKNKAILAGISKMVADEDVKVDFESPIDYIIDRITNKEHPSSINYLIGMARENARGARDNLSSEVWEAINKFYHYVHDYKPDNVEHEIIHTYTSIIINNTTIIRSLVNKTLLHNDVWGVVTLGIYLERAIQVTRILRAGIFEINALDEELKGGPVEFYQWTTLLKSAQALDMNRKLYQETPNEHNSLEFLILNKLFPNSVSFCLEQLETSLSLIDPKLNYNEKTSGFEIGKMRSRFRFLTIDDVCENVPVFLENTLNSLYNIGTQIEKEYLRY